MTRGDDPPAGIIQQDDTGRPAGGLPAKTQPWAPAMAALGIVIAVSGLGVAVYQIKAANDRLQLQTSMQTLFEWNRSQPANASQCLDLAKKLEVADWTRIYYRQRTTLPHELAELVEGCFSDQDDTELKKLFAGDELTPKGTAKLASIINGALGGDTIVASFILNNVANQKFLTDVVNEAICRDDQVPVARIRMVPSREKTFAALARFIEAPKPIGCKQR